jgi:hypothetical protein
LLGRTLKNFQTIIAVWRKWKVTVKEWLENKLVVVPTFFVVLFFVVAEKVGDFLDEID